VLAVFLVYSMHIHILFSLFDSRARMCIFTFVAFRRQNKN